MEEIRVEQVAREYARGDDFNNRINLYEETRRNENFYLGKQWEGVNAPDLEKPVLNFLKRVVSYFVSMIVSDDIGFTFEPWLRDDRTDILTKVLETEVDRVFERTKAKALNRTVLRDAAVQGDGAMFWRYDPEEREVALEVLPGTKLIFGNPYIHEVQKQPYLIVVQRRQLQDVRREAKEAGIDPQSIQPDSANRYSTMEEQADDLVTVLHRFWKQDSIDEQGERYRSVWRCKCTQEVMLEEPVDTLTSLYPVAMMNWERQEGNYHGMSAISPLIPNQIFINKMWAMAMEQQKKMAFPKVIYNRNLIARWTNRIGEAIGVSGSPQDAVAEGWRAPDMSAQVLEMVQRTIDYSKEFMGASDAALGNIRPDNTSAIVAVQKASSAPLELQRLSFLQFVEDCTRIVLDQMRAFYGERLVTYTDDDNNQVAAVVDFGQITPEALNLRVDVGAASYWSELMQQQTMDNLLQLGILPDSILYIESIPDGYIRNKNKILKRLREMQAQAQAQIPPEMMEGGTMPNEVPAM